MTTPGGSEERRQVREERQRRAVALEWRGHGRSVDDRPQGHPEAVIGTFRAHREYDPLPALRRYGGPKLSVITPVNDAPFGLHNLGADLPYTTFEGIGHWLQMDKPTLRGRDVAAVGSARGGGVPSVPTWGTYIWVESADDTVAEVTRAGGSAVMEPFGLLDAARMAVVADPAGAAFGVWQPGEHRGAQLVNEPGAWSMSQLNTRDSGGSKAFYGAVFGWETDTFDLGEGEITLWRLPGYVGGEPEQPVSREVVGVMLPMSDDRSPEDVSAHWSVDFWVDDVDAAADKAAELGGEVVVSTFAPSVGRTAVLADPQGAVFSVSKVGPGA